MDTEYKLISAEKAHKKSFDSLEEFTENEVAFHIKCATENGKMMIDLCGKFLPESMIYKLKSLGYTVELDYYPSFVDEDFKYTIFWREPVITEDKTN